MLSGVKHITCCREEISWSRRFAMPHTKSRFATVNCHVMDAVMAVLSCLWLMTSLRLVLCASFPVVGEMMPK